MKAFILFALSLVTSAQAFASEASVDRLTQRALGPRCPQARGAVEFSPFLLALSRGGSAGRCGARDSRLGGTEI